jgi:DMSO/TMAO reductase YedYZ molybdopterin-dependent catalytic subunit
MAAGGHDTGPCQDRRVNHADARALPPGQRPAVGWPVLHYGPVPADRRDRWDLTVTGATEDGDTHALDAAAFAALPRTRVHGDLHCVTRWSVPDNEWAGVAARTLLSTAGTAATERASTAAESSSAAMIRAVVVIAMVWPPAPATAK